MQLNSAYSVLDTFRPSLALANIELEQLKVQILYSMSKKQFSNVQMECFLPAQWQSTNTESVSHRNWIQMTNTPQKYTDTLRTHSDMERADRDNIWTWTLFSMLSASIGMEPLDVYHIYKMNWYILI